MLPKKDAAINLCISLFYNSTNWDILLTEGVRPFLAKTKGLLSYAINLSDLRGDHIRLVLRVNKKTAKATAQTAKFHFDTFIQSFPSESKGFKKENNPFLFMDFENNTVRYGLFDHWFANTHFQSEKFERQISLLIIQIFKEFGKRALKDLDEIIVQLLIIYFNTLALNNKEIIALLNVHLKTVRNNYDMKKWGDFRTKSQRAFEENKETLCNYISSCRENGNIEYDTEWENQWRQIIYGIDQENQKRSSLDLYDLFYTIFNRITTKLNSKNTLSIYCLFKDGLEYIEGGMGHGKQDFDLNKQMN
jgi:hypothetical protein